MYYPSIYLFTDLFFFFLTSERVIHTAFFSVNSCFSVKYFLFYFCFWCHIVKKVKLTVEISFGKAKMSIYMRENSED